MDEKYKYMVYVSCLTYNHAPYIKDALNGFCMQQTDFPYVCAILDDTSTDGEPDILREYLKQNFDLNDSSVVRNEETDDYILTFARHKTNRNCFFAVLFLKYNHFRLKKSRTPYVSEWYNNAKYIALCEGDDCWIHPQKLQMQVDILEKNPQYPACFGAYIKRDRDNNVPDNMDIIIKRNQKHNCITFGLNDSYYHWYTKTLTAVYRASILKEFDEVKSVFNYVGDTHLFYFIQTKGECVYFSNFLGIYNMHSGGIFSQRPKIENAIKSYNAYKELYEWSKDDYCLFNMFCSILRIIKNRDKQSSSVGLLFETLKIILRRPGVVVRWIDVHIKK